MQFGRVDGETIGSGLTPQQGFSPVGAPSPGGWVTLPSHGAAVAPSVTATTAATLDWSRYGVFPVQLTTNDACAFTFVNAAVGQTILIVATQPASSTAATVTLPAGSIVSNVNGGAATCTVSSSNSAVNLIRVTCTSPGVYIAAVN
jgi:hypothetical protein